MSILISGKTTRRSALHVCGKSACCKPSERVMCGCIGTYGCMFLVRRSEKCSVDGKAGVRSNDRLRLSPQNTIFEIFIHHQAHPSATCRSHVDQDLVSPVARISLTSNIGAQHVAAESIKSGADEHFPSAFRGAL